MYKVEISVIVGLILYLNVAILKGHPKAANLKTCAVVKDCSGTYLRNDGKDYHVCNAALLDSFPSGTKILVDYERVNECKDTSQKAICMLYHVNAGWIIVKTFNADGK